MEEYRFNPKGFSDPLRRAFVRVDKVISSKGRVVRVIARYAVGGRPEKGTSTAHITSRDSHTGKPFLKAVRIPGRDRDKLKAQHKKGLARQLEMFG